MGETEQARPGPLGRWRQRSAERRSRQQAAHALYAAIVAQAREPALYRELGVPDTNDGRFEMVALHAALVMRRLARAEGAGQELGQALFDLMFADIDRNLRELGVGDLSVGKKVKAIAASFLARAKALEAALNSADEAATVGILVRNLAGDGAGPTAAQQLRLARHILALDDRLCAAATGELIAGRLPAGAPPAASG